MTNLNALADRVEEARGGDRELDAEIAIAVDGGEIVWLTANYTMQQYPARRYASANHVGGYGKAPVPSYTASLDAAMTLVPQGWRIWTADFSISGLSTWMLSGPKQQWVTDEEGNRTGGDDWYKTGRGHTTAAALTAACLRARATGGSHG